MKTPLSSRIVMLLALLAAAAAIAVALVDVGNPEAGRLGASAPPTATHKRSSLCADRAPRPQFVRQPKQAAAEQGMQPSARSTTGACRQTFIRV